MLDRVKPRKAIALRLKQAREQAGYCSAKDFCERHKLRLVSYLKHEQGEKAVKMSKAEGYCRLLGISFRWLLLGEGTVRA